VICKKGLIGKNQEDSEVLKHGALRDISEVKHPLEGFRIVPKPNPNTFGTPNGD